MNRLIVIFCYSIAVIGCKTNDTNAHYDAMIDKHSEATINELQDVISNALGHSVPLTDRAFVGTNKLVLERKMQFTIEQGVLVGKDIEEPILFTLSIINNQCTVTQKSSGRSWPLTKANCVPYQPAK